MMDRRVIIRLRMFGTPLGAVKPFASLEGGVPLRRAPTDPRVARWPGSWGGSECKPASVISPALRDGLVALQWH